MSWVCLAPCINVTMTTIINLQLIPFSARDTLPFKQHSWPKKRFQNNLITSLVFLEIRKRTQSMQQYFQNFSCSVSPSTVLIYCSCFHPSLCKLPGKTYQPAQTCIHSSYPHPSYPFLFIQKYKGTKSNKSETSSWQGKEKKWLDKAKISSGNRRRESMKD